MNKRPLRVLAISAAFCLAVTSSKADKFTKEEQALLDKNRTMQMYKPDEHSRHFVAHIDSATDPKTGEKRKISKDTQSVLCFIFGMEDAQPAREQGKSMAEFKYSPQQAHEFLFAQGWENITTDSSPVATSRKARTLTKPRSKPSKNRLINHRAADVTICLKFL